MKAHVVVGIVLLTLGNVLLGISLYFERRAVYFNKASADWLDICEAENRDARAWMLRELRLITWGCDKTGACFYVAEGRKLGPPSPPDFAPDAGPGRRSAP